ncbi:MAG TPA: glycosyltransferase family 1 protein [Gammaproteobacteria bacterium]|nr:glycosyltransferase family 1 protein [Gammaproteobacteria bacterium]
MKIAVVIDTWLPEVNGVVTTMHKIVEELKGLGHETQVLSHADGFSTIPMPGYSSIRLALFPQRKVNQWLDRVQPDAIHISTEGPLGAAARRYCMKRGLHFTTCYHTKFPEYIRARAPIPLSVGYAWIRNFHAPASRLMVSTPSLMQELEDRGFKNLVHWGKGVDTELFRIRDKGFLKDKRPIFMYLGRVAVEKNIEAFLRLELPGSMYVVGDGPDLETLKKRYPKVIFTGFRRGEELAKTLAAADVFVFPSRTDTFGLVLLEAMACGVPVAAYPVTGPVDVVTQGVTGFCNEDLETAAIACLELDGKKCRAYAEKFSWKGAAEEFLRNMVPAREASEPQGERAAA